MSLLNYWHDYINTRFETVEKNITNLQSSVDSIEKFKLNKYEFTIHINGLSPDSEATIDGTIYRNNYILGI